MLDVKAEEMSFHPNRFFFLLFVNISKSFSAPTITHTAERKQVKKLSAGLSRFSRGKKKILKLSWVCFQGLSLQFGVINVDVETRCDSDRLGLA